MNRESANRRHPATPPPGRRNLAFKTVKPVHLLLGQCLLVAWGLFAGTAADLAPAASESSRFPCPDPEIASYTAYHTRETIRIDGHSHVKQDGIVDTSFLVSPTAFFQTNVGAARALVQLVIDGVLSGAPEGAPLRVLDLYAGSGLLSLPLVKAGARVTAVEENRQAMKDAEANIRLNRIPGGLMRLITSSVEDALPRVTRDPWDAVVLDPPRLGCPPDVLDAVFNHIAPPRAVYVSCNPEALAAELPVILNAGYRVTKIQPVDMFPHTDHIETVVALSRR